MGYHVLVLAGGSGTRLWPMSRGSTPKHLLPLAPGGRTLLRDTVERVRDLGAAVHVVTAESQETACRAELAGIEGRDLVIAEPAARGTGPALALAVAWIARVDPGALISSVHADARVADGDAYRAALVSAAGWADVTGGLATVGLTPHHPATGLGYIELGEQRDPSTWRRPDDLEGGDMVERAADLPAYRAAAFREKPEREVAERFASDGNHLWNLGLFAWRAPVFLAEVARVAPEMADVVGRVVERRSAGDEVAASVAYRSLEAEAVEPLILERGAPLTAVRAAFGWSDLGSWADFHEARVASGEADPTGNVLDGDALPVDSRDCTVIARGGRVVTVVGADSLVVVDTPDALLVVPADRAQRVKDAVERLRATGRDAVL